MKNLHWCDYLESGYLKENLTWGMIPMTYISCVCIHYISTHVTMEQPIKTRQRFGIDNGVLNDLLHYNV